MTVDTFRCPYAEAGQRRCAAWECDCFIDTHPDSPFDLHPEAFIVDGHARDLSGWCHVHDARCERGTRSD